MPAAGREQDRRRISGEPEEARMAQRDEPAIADDHVEPQREHGIEQDLARDVDVIDARHPERQAREHGERDDDRDEAAGGHGACLPKKPRGRSTSISTIGRNRTK